MKSGLLKLTVKKVKKNLVPYGSNYGSISGVQDHLGQIPAVYFLTCLAFYQEIQKKPRA